MVVPAAGAAGMATMGDQDAGGLLGALIEFGPPILIASILLFAVSVTIRRPALPAITASADVLRDGRPAQLPSHVHHARGRLQRVGTDLPLGRSGRTEEDRSVTPGMPADVLELVPHRPRTVPWATRSVTARVMATFGCPQRTLSAGCECASIRHVPAGDVWRNAAHVPTRQPAGMDGSGLSEVRHAVSHHRAEIGPYGGIGGCRGSQLAGGESKLDGEPEGVDQFCVLGPQQMRPDDAIG